MGLGQNLKLLLSSPFYRESALQTRAYIPAGERRRAFDDGDRNPERWVFRWEPSSSDPASREPLLKHESENVRPWGVCPLTPSSFPYSSSFILSQLHWPIAAHQTCQNYTSASGYLACFALCLDWVNWLIHVWSSLSSVLLEAANRYRINPCDGGILQNFVCQLMNACPDSNCLGVLEYSWIDSHYS